MSDDNLETKVETSRKMEDDPMENNKGAGKKHELPCIMYSQIYIMNWYNSFSFSIEKDRVGEKYHLCEWFANKLKCQTFF